MDASLSEQNNPLQTRSFSLPSKLIPINKRIEEELQKLRAKEATSTSPTETISIDLTGLADLYKCINEVLSLPLTQQALSLHHHHEKHVCELMLKGCSNLQNVCSTLREIVLQQTKNASGTRSVLLHMKNKGYSSSYYECKVASYFSSRKEVIKRAKRVTLSLQQLVDSPRLFQEEEDQRLSTVIKALTCITMINISIFESLSVFLSAPVTKQKSGSLISKLIPKSRSKSVYQAKMGNELMDVDVTIYSLCSGDKAEKVDIAQKRLEEMIGAMEGVENSLESVYTQLVEAKAFLLSMVSFSVR